MTTDHESRIKESTMINSSREDYLEEQVEQLKSEIDRLRATNAQLEEALHQSEAGAAVMREVLKEEKRQLIRYGRENVEHRRMHEIDQALSTDAGKSLLAELDTIKNDRDVLERELTACYKAVGVSTCSSEPLHESIHELVVNDRKTLLQLDQCKARLVEAEWLIDLARHAVRTEPWFKRCDAWLAAGKVK